ncbi:MAG TPA: VWA domain-containing protein, partial [Myxococcota bacterium]|nr:VWA domain-containing protein [Myxococcota bacterium]
MKLSIWLTRFSLVVVVLTAAIGLSMVGCGNSNQGSDVSENIDIIQTNCLSFDRVSHHVYPPAGIQIGFRLLDCDGYPVKRLGESNLTVINDEKGQPFGKGKKGGGVSAPGTPSEFGLYSILVLDMSDSIFRNDAVDDVLDGAKVFVKKVVSDADEGLKHKVAIMVFGMPSKTEIVQDFTDDAAVLNNVLDGLRSSSSLGTTDLYGSYQKAAAAVAAKGGDLDVVERSVIILTDGTHEAGDEENMRGNALTAKAQYEDAGVTFFSIGIKGEYDEERIRELASKADYFVLADDASSLTGIFGDISARVKALADSNYVVGVCTPVVFGSPTLTLKVNLDGTTADHTLAYSVGNLTGDVANCNPDWILNPCEGLECGSGHVGGVNCGKCDGGYSCQSGQCVEDECV